MRDELPDIPLWEGTTFKGTVINDSEICVDRILKKSSADLIGGGRRSHVVVSWPDLTTGEPQDGACAKADENAEKEITAGRQFFLEMDDYAIQLDEAVGRALDDDPTAVDRVADLRQKMLDRVNRYVLSDETSIGGNLLTSAATTARDAARDADLATLARVRGEIADARRKLADEAIN